MSNFLKDGERRRKMPDGSFVTIDRNGNIVDDGEVVSVPMWMMDNKSVTPSVPTFDASLHRPHQIAATDSDKVRVTASYSKMMQRLNDGCKQSAPTVSDSVGTVLRRGAKETAAPSTEAKDAHDRYRQRVENAWRNL